ncbi:NAD(P)H-binding protein [Bacteriovoracales bacterium]|nr:NAD(P)H-binding protein [Bacteriovoracales bacterium]
MGAEKGKKIKIAIAGASGFVGRHLMKHLERVKNYQVRALTRSFEEDNKLLSVEEKNDSNIEWVQCDLFSMIDVETALEGADYAIYLVHSMLPTSKLVQANFQDNDLIIADNFSRVAKKKGIKQIIYLGGIIPPVKDLSLHLKSRLETEETLRHYNIPVTSLRAGIIIGRGGSSFNILKKLVERLPVMILPSWTQNASKPVAIEDVIKSIEFCIGNKETFNKEYDLGGQNFMTYHELLEEMAAKLGHKRYFFKVSLFSPGLSKLWVSLITNTPKNLVYPLIQSLKHPMIPDKQKLLSIPNYKFKSFKESVEASVDNEDINPRPSFGINIKGKTKYWGTQLKRKDVRSIQRLHRPENKSSAWIAQKYMEWLPQFFSFIIKVNIKKNVCSFVGPFFKTPLLELSLSMKQSSPDRQIFYITGGYLASKDQGRGRFEFRETSCGKYFLVAIHEYIPSLPWFIYIYTQAVFHAFVMKKFQAFIKKMS